ncbi:LysR substrate-binding domain-containing protein [Pseudomonas aeruginosa]|uniref:LysR substrate-binding domain-containing protein n=1 Tax=Pseudomonas aeruginosa TaxID=287 RepID=UPI000B9A9B18|nr:LysR substrate-binding domain-containing protein [Pseudomonas aeruginosa]
MQLRADRLDVVFVAGTPELPDCHSRHIWTEPLLAVLPERHPFAERVGPLHGPIWRATFLVRHGRHWPASS